MSLINWNPQKSFLPAFSNWVDDFFSDSMDWLPTANGKRISVPAVNVKELDKTFQLEVAAPGYQKDDFKIRVDNGYLTISAETKAEQKEENEKFTRREFSYQSFSRSFHLPETVEGSRIEASYTDGILQLSLPKTSSAPKKGLEISVK
jgi:HSP20 family protein